MKPGPLPDPEAAVAFSTRFSHETAVELRALAAEHSISIAAVVRELVREQLLIRETGRPQLTFDFSADGKETSAA